MKKIYLKNKDINVVVDDQDFDSLNKLKWYLSSTGYAVRRMKGKTTYMHRIICNTPDGLFVDHINRNRLDNRRSNLRNVTWAENRNNISVHKDNVNKTLNIDFHRNVYRVRIQRNKQQVFIAYSQSLDGAVSLRDEFLHGTSK